MSMETRKFGLLDAATFIAALAAGFYLARIAFYEIVPLLPNSRVLRVPFVCRVVHHEFAACAAPLGAAMISLRLRRPRPDFSEVLAQPGFAGCIASTIVFALCLLNAAPDGSLSRALFLASIANAYAIVAAWFATCFGGPWNSQPGWIDRIARMVCIFWLVSPFLLSLSLSV
jgi:hypothetical protein